MHVTKRERMKQKTTKWRVRSLCAAITMSIAGAASAGIPVIDGANFAVNEIKKLELFTIMMQLDSGGEINTYTKNIDDSTESIEEHTENINKTTESILDYTVKNYEISFGDFQVIIGGGGEEVAVADIAGNFGSVEGYRGKIADQGVLVEAGMDGSRARKDANDQLVKTMIEQQGSIQHDADQVTQLLSASTEAQGHGNQYQYANAIAGEEAHQLLQLRSLMLASSNAKSATTRARADRKSHEIAAAESLRRATPTPANEGAAEVVW